MVFAGHSKLTILEQRVRPDMRTSSSSSSSEMVRTGFLVVSSLRCFGLESVVGLNAWAIDGCLESTKAEQDRLREHILDQNIQWHNQQVSIQIIITIHQTLSNMVHIPFFAAGFFFAAVFFGAALGSDMDLKISLLTLSSSSSLITVAAESI